MRSLTDKNSMAWVRQRYGAEARKESPNIALLQEAPGICSALGVLERRLAMTLTPPHVPAHGQKKEEWLLGVGQILRNGLLFGYALEKRTLDMLQLRHAPCVGRYFAPFPVSGGGRDADAAVGLYQEWVEGLRSRRDFFPGKPYVPGLECVVSPGIVNGLCHPLDRNRAELLLECVASVDSEAAAFLARTPRWIAGKNTVLYEYVAESNQGNKKGMVDITDALRHGAVLGWLLEHLHRLELETLQMLNVRKYLNQLYRQQGAGKSRAARELIEFAAPPSRGLVGLLGKFLPPEAIPKEYLFVPYEGLSRAICLVNRIMKRSGKKARTCGERILKQLEARTVLPLVDDVHLRYNVKNSYYQILDNEHRRFLLQGGEVMDEDGQCAVCSNNEWCRHNCRV